MKLNWKYLLVGILLVGGALGLGFWLGQSTDSTSSAGAPASDSSEAQAEQIWTCSMHPQVRQPEPGICPICEMDLIPLDQEEGESDPLVLKMTRQAVRLAQVQTSEVRRGDAEGAILTFSGKVVADERRISSQTAHVAGRIEALHVSFTGERVRKGQPLATLYSPELLAAQRELLEAVRMQEYNPDLLEAARRKLYYWKIPEEVVREIETTGNIRPEVEVVADASGVVVEKYKKVGDHVMEGSVLYDLANLDRLWVMLDAYEEDLPKVGVGDRIRISVPALAGETFETRITYIDPLIDPETRVASLRAEVVNPGNLKPEMFVRATLLPGATTQQQDPLLVPRSAVLWTGRRSVVYVAQPGDLPAYEYREILLGEQRGDYYVVEAGLREGERVVSQGSFAIDAAAQLKNQRSMMNRHIEVEGMEVSLLPDYRASVGPGFKQELKSLLTNYFQLKDALVATDRAAATEAGEKIGRQLESMQTPELTGAPQTYWLNKRDALRSHLQLLVEADEIAAQRKQFEFISNLLIELYEVFGSVTSDLYVQHCPMAFDDAGADWLSNERGILNPYFGDKMLKCGIVTDSILALKE